MVLPKSVILLLIISTGALLFSTLHSVLTETHMYEFDEPVESDFDQDGVSDPLEQPLFGFPFEPVEEMSKDRLLQAYKLVEGQCISYFERFERCHSSLQKATREQNLAEAYLEMETEKVEFYKNEIENYKNKQSSVSWVQIITNLITWGSGITAIILMWRKDFRETKTHSGSKDK
ncbi:hypothetical protein [Alteromonas macleodii]|uniref:Transmembrane protein n=1 Tax=Alteromonas macleodii TaxID=28108 RepID=A0AB36FNE6_ALTMA|nr:hypothetical protein [Alteromonas macleodii]OES23735.1 hypothetical protein BFV93_4926 [Alteromonas macleodii]OES23948.1 hypothetical protein BFV94_4898 [Alteromonas macleodii]OES25648.1 hypothetical protein BFV95_4330 [Alteromonas macleodii]OES38940.1 hypothetical protein BFV96_4538 [Alteromonas macleodii]